MKLTNGAFLATVAVFMLLMTACGTQLLGPSTASVVTQSTSAVSAKNAGLGQLVAIVDPDDPGGTTERQAVILYAGQSVVAGEVAVSVVDNELWITYETTEGWTLNEVHAWVGKVLSQMPQTGTGNPQVGRFPYKGHGIADTTYPVTVPLSDLGDNPCGKTFRVAAHASVRTQRHDGTFQTESAWADGERLVTPGNWATYFEFTLTCVEPAYRIGDIGPAGGHIFYVDEADEFPWTYLEVAPAETEWERKPWGGATLYAVGTSTAIGAGKANTDATVARVGSVCGYSGRSDYAAKLCADLQHGGFSDWFLPSKDELNLIYNNLHLSGIGEFGPFDYWSSSEPPVGPAVNAWSQRFVDVLEARYYFKNGYCWVRAVRAF